jgi:glycosyltransferase involved in cell wall biosynthesis
MRRSDVRVVAVSSFTAGALARKCRAGILPPGLSRDWFRILVEAADQPREKTPAVRIMTAFRLAEWQGKGLPELIDAIVALRRTEVRLVICGSGAPPEQLQNLVRRHSFCRLLPGLTDRELALQLAGADLFVLATRTRPGRDPSGEGFGMVLLEAQVAGTPVIGPAHGGSHDAYVEGVTGATPVDETSEGLAVTVEHLLRDRQQLAHMGDQAARWARESFGPESYARLAVMRLL